MSSEKHLLGSAPLFIVQDLHRSLDYYCDVLGFKRPKLWGDPPGFAMPERDGLILMLSQAYEADSVHPNAQWSETWDAYFWVKDARLLIEEFRSKGAVFGHELVEKTLYGMLEFTVRDPDGYLLCFGSSHEEG